MLQNLDHTAKFKTPINHPTKISLIKKEIELKPTNPTKIYNNKSTPTNGQALFLKIIAGCEEVGERGF